MSGVRPWCVRLRVQSSDRSRAARAARAALAVTAVVLCLGRVVPAQAQSVPSPWVSQDIGGPQPAGSASFASGVFTASGSGKEIYNAADQFQFVYQPVAGDVEIIARVDSVSPTQKWSKAGVMIRGSLTTGSAHALVAVTVANGIHFQRRSANGGSTVGTAGEVAAPPRWVRLVRVGTQLTASSSSNGTTWTTIGTDTIALGTTAYVGLAVSSQLEGELTTA